MANHRHANNFIVQGLLVLLLSVEQISYGYTVSVAAATTTKATVLELASSKTATEATVTPASATSTPSQVGIGETSAPTITPTATPSSTIYSILPEGSSGMTRGPPNKIRGSSSIRESLFIPATNSEREAQELYDKALKQYGSYGAKARETCSIWELRGCQCYGTVEELTLACRSIGFEQVPLDLPLDIVKL